jgi:hypothetical protein
MQHRASSFKIRAFLLFFGTHRQSVSRAIMASVPLYVQYSVHTVGTASTSNNIRMTLLAWATGATVPVSSGGGQQQEYLRGNTVRRMYTR